MSSEIALVVNLAPNVCLTLQVLMFRSGPDYHTIFKERRPRGICIQPDDVQTLLAI